MAQKAELKGKINLDSSGFERGIQRSKKSVKSFVTGAAKQFAVMAGAAGVAGLSRAAMDLGQKMSDLSKLSGTSVEEFQKFSFAAQSVGVENEKLGDILKDVSDKVGDFLQTGGGPMADFFNKIAPQVGVTAEQFRNLSGKDALQLYVKSLEEANISQNEMTFFMEAIASDATLLLPLLQDNAQALTTLGEEAQSLGLIMDSETIEQLKAASIELNQFQTQVVILSGIVLSKVIPAFQMFGNGLGGVGDVIGGTISKFIIFFEFLARNTRSALEPVNQALRSTGNAILGVGKALSGDLVGASKSFGDSLDSTKKSFQALADLPGKMVEEYKRADEDMKNVNESVYRGLEERSDRSLALWKRMTGSMVKESEAANKTIISSNNKLAEESPSDVKKAKAKAEKEEKKEEKKNPQAMPGFQDKSSDPEYIRSLYADMPNVEDFVKSLSGGGSTPSATQKTETASSQLTVLNQMNGSLKTIEREMTR